MKQAVVQLENEHLRFVLNHDGSGESFVKASGAVWRQGPVAVQEDGWGKARRESFDAAWSADRWHGSVALEEMIDHEVLSEDGALRRSVFASGKAVTANLAETPREGRGATLAGLEYRIE